MTPTVGGSGTPTCDSYVRTDVRDVLTNNQLPLRDDLSVSNAREKRSNIYIVEWPDPSFVKVGVAKSPSRWRAFVRRGGILRYLHEDTSHNVFAMEQDMHSTLWELGYRPIFTCQEDARPFLGGVGRGWTECVAVPPGHGQRIAEVAAERRDNCPDHFARNGFVGW